MARAGDKDKHIHSLIAYIHDNDLLRNTTVVNELGLIIIDKEKFRTCDECILQDTDCAPYLRCDNVGRKDKQNVSVISLRKYKSRRRYYD